MDDQNFQEMLLAEIALYFQPLQRIADEEEGVLFFFEELGWDLESVFGPSAPDFVNTIAGLGGTVGAIEDLARNASLEDFEDFAAILQEILPLVQTVKALADQPLSVPPEVNLGELVEDLFNALTIIYIGRKSDFLLSTLVLLTVVEHRTPVAVVSGGRVVRLQDRFPKINFEKIGLLFSDPAKLLKDEYWPDGMPDIEAANRVAARLFPRLAYIFNALDIQTFVGRGLGPMVLSPEEEQRFEGSMTLIKAFPPIEERGRVKIGTTVHLVPESENGPGVYLSPFGEAELDLSLAEGWHLIAGLAAGVDGIKITRNGFEIASSLGSNFIETSLRLLKQGAENAPALRIGSAAGTRLEIRDFEAGGRLLLGDRREDYGVSIELKNCAIVVSLGQGDGFLSSVGGEGFRIDFDLLIGWSKTLGVYFGGSVGLEFILPAHIQVGPLEIRNLTIALRLRGSTLPLEASATFKLELGPFTAVVENAGLRLVADLGAAEKNAGFANISMGFKPPTGIGLSLETPVVRGAGYILFDTENEQYAGALELSIQGTIQITAIAVITTRFPDNTKGFSLLLIVSVTFSPGITLGMGFFLSGLGGLIGINRTINTEAMRAGVRTGAIDNIMFPENIMSNITRIISDIRTIFPPKQDQFMIGFMARITWGVPSLVTIDFGLIVEFANPVRIAILGVLKIVLPTEEAALIRIQVNFLGILDFEKGELSFDASLFGSRILTFTLEGDMAVRLSWGAEKNFILSIGGFHPAFDPPAGLTDMRRLGLVILPDNPRIALTTYFAVTSNTVQFGARIELRAAVAGFSVEGELGFDVLFQFSPFKFVARIYASVAIKAGGSTLLAIRLDLQLEGPTPWIAQGVGSFSILFFEVSVSFRVQWGEERQDALPDIQVLPRLIEALSQNQNWIAELPANKTHLCTLREIKLPDGVILLSPFGMLTVQQNILPMDIDFDRFGDNNPQDARRVSIAALRIGDAEVPTEKVKAAFAPANFRAMSDEDKLKSPSYAPENSGVRLSGGEELVVQYATPRTVQYDVITSDFSSEEELPYELFMPTYMSGVFFNAEWFTPLALGGVVGDAPLSKEYKAKKMAIESPHTVKITAGNYQIVYADTLEPFAASLIGSKAQVDSEMASIIDKNPDMFKKLRVVQEFEFV